VADDFTFDPFDAAFFEDPYPAYTRMRHEFPAYRRQNENPRVWPHYWMLSRGGLAYVLLGNRHPRRH
jgi:hypothetical protein